MEREGKEAEMQLRKAIVGSEDSNDERSNKCELTMNLCLVGKRAKNCLIDGYSGGESTLGDPRFARNERTGGTKKSSGRRHDAIHCCIRRDDPREVLLRDPHCAGRTLHDAPKAQEEGAALTLMCFSVVAARRDEVSSLNTFQQFDTTFPQFDTVQLLPTISRTVSNYSNAIKDETLS
mmetsp:Transcript_15808/g.35592  ORF Transcript_15808/g.35592 Transcript_15808/m.35592 type:complete len:178 (-) Transcript_15808:172-705(-)